MLKFPGRAVAIGRMNFDQPILVIDDDQGFAEAMEGMLEAAGHTAAVARNAFHGLKLARELRPAVVVCDLVMPDMTGIDLLRTLAADPATENIPRVLMSGRTDADLSCAHAFLQKPFEAADMISVFRKVSRTYSTRTAPDVTTDAVWKG